MSSLAELPELVGFFSYSREDDADSQGALSALRGRIQGELRGQLGRTAKTFRLWQDKEAIPSGSLWETEIRNSVAQSVFFIPIITPTVVASPYCRFELESFLAREKELGRDDLVFPILYVDVPELENVAQRQKDPVLSIIARRQYRDWREFRYLEVNAPEIRREVARFCTDIRNALRRSWLSPEERKQQEDTAARQKAAEEVRLQQAEATPHAEPEQSRSSLAQLPAWQKSRPALIAGSLAGVLVLSAIGAWFVATPRPAAVAPVPSPPVTKTPAPAAPVPPAATPTTAPGSPTRITAKPLSVEQERALKAGEAFKECDNCPEMVVVPAGSFMMGSPEKEALRRPGEGPQHRVTFAKPFAVGRFAVTFDEWDACVTDGGCNGYKPSDQGWGRGKRPVIEMSLGDARAYVAWLSGKTGKPYRLLSESEREYVTRAGTTTPFWWGSSVSTDQANFDGKWTYADWSTGGSIPDKGEQRKKTLPVDSFQSNPWGLYQVHGNVDEWVEDCFRPSVSDLPSDGSAAKTGNCQRGVVRGGYYDASGWSLRAAARFDNPIETRCECYGFRVARTL